MASRRQSRASHPDDALVARVADGDPRAFEILVNQALGPTLAVARRITGNEAEAEDIAQEALLRLWRHAEKWQPGRARVTTWLYKVATNLSLDRIRQRKHEPLEAADELESPADQEEQVLELQLAKRVDAALQELPEAQRVALVLCHYQGLTMKEAGDVMERSEEAIESLLARARRRLKRELEDEWRALLPDPEL